jgi:hypothetical protein
MVVEEVPTEQSPVLQSRFGMEDEGTTLGTGPVKALYQVDGVIDGAQFAVSGSKFYADGIELGTIDGSGEASIAGFESFIFAAAGAGLWGWNGVTLAEVTLPDNFDALRICVGASRLLVIKKTTGRFYWSDVLSSTVDALSFATAENTPDKLLDCLYVGDVAVLFGAETVEFWQVSTDPDLPFLPIVGRVFQKGIKATGCASHFQGSFAWVTNRNQICVGSLDQVITTPDIDAKIEASTVVRLWSFYMGNDEFLALTLDSETLVFSSRSSQWSEFQTLDENWRPRCFGGGLFGSSIDGKLIQWSDDYYDHEGNLTRILTAGIAIPAQVLNVFNLIVRTNSGRTPILEGYGYDPMIELRTSKDGGFTYGSWKEIAFGENGQYRKNIMWRSLGSFGRPGFVCQVRVTRPVPFRVSGVYINEPYGAI